MILSIAELDLPTLLFGFVSMFATAVAMLYRDMRRDMKVLTDNAALERQKCDTEMQRLYKELEDLRYGPCLKKDCPMNIPIKQK